jgi:hypothetical protein
MAQAAAQVSKPFTIPIITSGFHLLTDVIRVGGGATVGTLRFLFNNAVTSTLILIGAGGFYVLQKVYDELNSYSIVKVVSKEDDPVSYFKLDTEFGNIYLSSDEGDSSFFKSFFGSLPNISLNLKQGKADVDITPNTAGYVTDVNIEKDVTDTPKSPKDTKEEIIYLISNDYVSSTKTMSIVTGSVGINIPQVLVACVEDAAITKGNFKNALIAGASVGVSNLVPAYYSAAGMWGSGTEKYLVEPIVAGILYSIGAGYMSSAEKEGSMLKRFSKGFIIGASSAAVAGSVMSSTITTSRVPSQYSSGSGLRSGAGTSSAKVPTSYPNIVVA